MGKAALVKTEEKKKATENWRRRKFGGTVHNVPTRFACIQII